MIPKEHLEISTKLYKPTKKVVEMVEKLCDLFDKPLPNGVTIRSLTFDGSIQLCDGLRVKQVVRTDNHLAIEIHWFPNYQISTTDDPYCSAFVLKYNTLRKLYQEVEKVFTEFNVKA